MLSANSPFLYLPLKVPPGVDIDLLTITVSLSRDDENPSSTWYPAERSGDGVRLMVGEASDVGRLAVGAWWAYAKLEGPGLDGQVLVLRAGSFVIEGGPTASSPSSGISFDSDGTPYFDPLGGGTSPLLIDTDGTPYVED